MALRRGPSRGSPRLLAESRGPPELRPGRGGSRARSKAPSDFPLASSPGTSTYYWHQNNIMKKTFIPRREYNALLLLYPQGAGRDPSRRRRPARRPRQAAGPRRFGRGDDGGGRPGDRRRPARAWLTCPYFVGPMVPGFLKPHAAVIDRGEDAVIPVRIEKV